MVEGPSTVRVQWGLREDACYDRQQLLFTVQYQRAGQGEGQWTTVLSRASLPTNEYLVVGLQPSTQYRFRVGVTSRNGQLALGVSQTVMTLIGEWEGQWVWQSCYTRTLLWLKLMHSCDITPIPQVPRPPQILFLQTHLTGARMTKQLSCTLC